MYYDALISQCLVNIEIVSKLKSWYRVVVNAAEILASLATYFAVLKTASIFICHFYIVHALSLLSCDRIIWRLFVAADNSLITKQIRHRHNSVDANRTATRDAAHATKTYAAAANCAAVSATNAAIDRPTDPSRLRMPRLRYLLYFLNFV